VYPYLGSDCDPHTKDYYTRAILATKNEDVDNINHAAFTLFPGDQFTYTSTDTIIDSDDPDSAIATYPVEFLRSLNPSGMPSHILQIKVGMPLIILRNIDPEYGLCNGTKVYATQVLPHSITIKRYDDDTNSYVIPRIHFCSNDDDYPFKLRRTQLPVRPAFAMTIHKSQGQTLDHVGVYLKDPVFSHGQLYVALSRVTDPKNLKIAIPFKDNTSNDTTKNIVYPQILLS
jgi:ATP-dependent DNA helicase PIF1